MNNSISVVIPAHNALGTIEQCLKGLFEQTVSRGTFEIIVVDDGSRDTTREIARARGLRVLGQPNLGAAAARNLGAENARGDIILFLDADCIPDSPWIEKMVAPFADASIVGTGGMKRTYQRGIVPRFIQMEFDDRYDRVHRQAYIDFIDSGTAAYRRDVFLRNGGFDTRLEDAEDTELSFRLSLQGCRMAFAPDAVVYHAHPDSLWLYLKRKFIYSYWRSFVYGRFPQKIARDSRTPQTQKMQAALALLFVASAMTIPFWSIGIWLTAACALLLILATLSFSVKYVRRDASVALVAPLFITLSAFATGAGIALGFLRQCIDSIILRTAKDAAH